MPIIMDVRLLTFNIHGWRTLRDQPNLGQIAQAVAATEADIVGLNEVFHPYHFSADSYLPTDRSALEQLAERLDMHFVFGPCLRWPATDDLPERSYGNALLARWPIIASAAHHLTPVAGKEQRGLLEARVLLPDDRPFTVYVTHLDQTDEEARLTQLRAVRSWTVRDRNRPHVVMGDFNAVHPWDYEHRPDEMEALARHPASGLGEKGPQVIAQMEKAGYTDAMQLVGEPGQQTFIPAADALRLDYIWVSQPLVSGVRRAQVWQEPPGEEASDHRPLLVELEL